jgi:ubiquinone/menaquinone biosynthesis C-methylase UbiE
MKDSLAQWDNAAEWYDQNMGVTGDTLNATIIRPVILEMLGDLTGTSILDAGCGSGYLTAELATHAMQVTGTDFAPSFISLCQQKYTDRNNLKFAVQDVEQPFQFDDMSFDTIVCKMVLQYVPDIRPFASEAMRMLKPGGTLLIVVDHPCRAVYFNIQQQGGSAPNSDDYFSENPKTKLSLWGKTELTWYARTTSNYVQLFIENGFKLAEIREPLAVQDTPIPFSVLALKFTK